MIGRRPVPTPPAGDSTSAQLIALTARIDQALTIADQSLRANTANRQLVDVCLDIRNALNPPART